MSNFFFQIKPTFFGWRIHLENVWDVRSGGLEFETFRLLLISIYEKNNPSYLQSHPSVRFIGLHLMSSHSLTTLMKRPRENIVLILHSLIINPCSLLILIQFLKSDRLRFVIKSPSQNSDWLRNRADAAFHNCNSSTNSVLTKSSCLFNGFHGLRNAQYLFILWTNGMS